MTANVQLDAGEPPTLTLAATDRGVAAAEPSAWLGPNTPSGRVRMVPGEFGSVRLPEATLERAEFPSGNPARRRPSAVWPRAGFPRDAAAWEIRLTDVSP
jgi:hypothetical protein